VVALKADIPRLELRAILINSAVFFAVSCGLSTILLMVVAFMFAFMGFAHERGVAVLFILSVGLFGAALLQFLREIQIALRKTDHFA
jgi:hypothetical protein